MIQHAKADGKYLCMCTIDPTCVICISCLFWHNKNLPRKPYTHPPPAFAFAQAAEQTEEEERQERKRVGVGGGGGDGTE